MAECSEISLLIGPFEDGELEPHEMQEVARHLAACSSCESILNDYSLIGREMRNLATLPPLDGFANGVLARIGAHPLPWRNRIAGWFDEFVGQISGTLAIGALAAAVAIVTAIVVTPYAQKRITRGLTPIASVDTKTVAALDNSLPALGPANPLASSDGGAILGGKPDASSGAMEPPAYVASSRDSHAVISRLESQIPSVAVWSEPESDTTVIWLPEQQQ